MSDSLNIAFFGSSLLSAYWNGAATYYRGIIRALDALGYRVTFYEPDAFERQKHRDMDPPGWADVHVYEATTAGVYRSLELARGADILVKASGVGVFDELLEREIPGMRRAGAMALFWDVDAPATLDRMQHDPSDLFHSQVGKYDLVLTYGGGSPVVEAYKRAGARECIPVYNALDPSTHYPVAPDPEYQASLGFLGNRLPDREARVDEFFFRAATAAPTETFLLGGNGWGDKAMPANVRYAGHVGTVQHNAFNCTPRAVLNISRESMARYGFSPATRVFEAAGAASCLITDDWEGIPLFLEPGKEILVARDGDEVAGHLRRLSPERAQSIGQAALQRVLAEHTYEHRAKQVDAILTGRFTAVAGR
ncbi:MAG TPA: glycosyltransferase [Bryobacteraceae bacterium]|nr:glycosyltransferase [Bryobacteraceae bacterium]